MAIDVDIFFASLLATAFLDNFYMLSRIATTAEVLVSNLLLNTGSNFRLIVSVVQTAAAELIDHNIFSDYAFLKLLDL
jgi:hypothetical protein